MGGETIGCLASRTHALCTRHTPWCVRGAKHTESGNASSLPCWGRCQPTKCKLRRRPPHYGVTCADVYVVQVILSQRLPGDAACFLSDIPFLTIERLPKEVEPLPNPPPAKEDFACQPIAPPAREALGAQTDPLPVPPLMTERNTGTDAPAPAPVMTPRQAQTDPEPAAVAVPTDTMWCQTDAPEDATQVYTRGLQTDPLPELPRLEPEPVTHFSFESFGVDEGGGATGCLPVLTSTQNLGVGGTGGASTTPGMAMGASTLGGMGGFNSSSAGACGHGADQSLLGITNSALAEAIFPGSTVTPKRPPPVRAQVNGHVRVWECGVCVGWRRRGAGDCHCNTLTRPVHGCAARSRCTRRACRQSLSRTSPSPW